MVDQVPARVADRSTLPDACMLDVQIVNSGQEWLLATVARLEDVAKRDRIQERFLNLVAVAREGMDAARAALGTAAAGDAVFEASIGTARMLGFVEGIATLEPAIASDLLAQAQPIIDEIAELSEQARTKVRPWR
jgi:hypothetical protein